MEERDEARKNPMYRKAVEILEITEALCETFTDEEDEMQMKQFMMENAFVIPPKIYSALLSEDYSIQIENAVIVRKAAREQQAATSSLKMENLSENKYLQLLREAISEFRVYLKEWVEGLDFTTAEEWEWSLNIKGSII